MTNYLGQLVFFQSYDGTRNLIGFVTEKQKDTYKVEWLWHAGEYVARPNNFNWYTEGTIDKADTEGALYHYV